MRQNKSKAKHEGQKTTREKESRPAKRGPRGTKKARDAKENRRRSGNENRYSTPMKEQREEMQRGSINSSRRRKGPSSKMKYKGDENSSSRRRKRRSKNNPKCNKKQKKVYGVNKPKRKKKTKGQEEALVAHGEDPITRRRPRSNKYEK